MRFCFLLFLSAITAFACSTPTTGPKVESPEGAAAGAPAEETRAPVEGVLLFPWWTYYPAACPDGALECRDTHYDDPDQVDGELMIPVACVNDEGFWAQEGCQELVEEMAKGHEQPMLKNAHLSRCEADGSTSFGFLTEKAGEHPQAWPSQALQSIDLTKEGGAAPASIAPMLESSGATLDTLQVRQHVELDLDGDGDLDHLYSLSTAPKDDIYYLFSGLYLEETGGEPKLLYESDLTTFVIVAITDLNQDGKLELLLESAYYEGTYYEFLIWEDGQFVSLSSFGCGA